MNETHTRAYRAGEKRGHSDRGAPGPEPYPPFPLGTEDANDWVTGWRIGYYGFDRDFADKRPSCAKYSLNSFKQRPHPVDDIKDAICMALYSEREKIEINESSKEDAIRLYMNDVFFHSKCNRLTAIVLAAAEEHFKRDVSI